MELNYNELQEQTESLTRKIKHYLMTTSGTLLEEANDVEFYRAFASALREEVMINWSATHYTRIAKKPRTLYYLSMEYMLGRVITNNITNLKALDLVNLTMKKTGRSLESITSIEQDPGLGNGGLGRLAACFLDSLATLKYPSQGYGLRYQYGIFEQSLEEGRQIERPELWLLHAFPWEFRKDAAMAEIKFGGNLVNKLNLHGDNVTDVINEERIRAIPYDIPIVGFSFDNNFSVATLRLWSTKESPRNFQLQSFNSGHLDQAAENIALTDILYPNDNNETGKRIRLKQEFLLVAASLQDIVKEYKEHNENFDDFCDKVRIQINDTHPALAVVELYRLLNKQKGISPETAWEMTKTTISYTNHTVLREALEEWEQHRIQSLLPRQYEILEQLNLMLCNQVRKHYPDNEEKVRRMSILEDGKVKMAHLAIFGSHKVNGVAALHSKIIKEQLFKDFHDMDPDKFTNVTNGITQRRWLLHCNPQLAKVITEKIGDEWITNFSKISEFAQFSEDPATQNQLLEIKQENKQNLISFLKEKYQSKLFKSKEDQFATIPFLSTSQIFSSHIKRFHEYKRQLLTILNALMIYNDFLENPQSRQPRAIIFAGKAAPGYEMAKNIIQLVYCVAKKINNDRATQGKLNVVFVENYNVSAAEKIIPASDLSIQVSTAGMEASGTGNMKLAINGALTIGTEDGANIEMHEEVGDNWWPFSFGCKAEEIQEMKSNGLYNPWDIYHENSKIKKAIDTIGNGSLSDNAYQQQALNAIYHSLLESHHGNPPDQYFVLKDLQSYYETDKKVEELYQDTSLWSQYCIHNIAKMGKFSSDRSIHDYANNIWGINPLSLDDCTLNKIREEFREHDRCRILY
jgi:glycogen phosphorylase